MGYRLGVLNGVHAAPLVCPLVVAEGMATTMGDSSRASEKRGPR